MDTNLAAGLAEKGKRTLLIDLDPQANLTIGIGAEPESFSVAIHHVLLKKAPISEAILKIPPQKATRTNKLTLGYHRV
jgi:chromosome partitioning protein